MVVTLVNRLNLICQYDRKRAKKGKGIVFKAVLKGYFTSIELINMFLCSFIWLNIPLNIDLLCSIYCGEKSKRFTPLVLPT